MDSNQIDRFLSGSAYKVKYLDAGSFQYYLNNDGSWKPHVIEKNPDYIYGVLNLDRAGGPGTHWVAVIQMPNGAGGKMTIFMDPLTTEGAEQLKNSTGLLNFKKRSDVILKGKLQTDTIKKIVDDDTPYSDKSKKLYWSSRRGNIPMKIALDKSTIKQLEKTIHPDEEQKRKIEKLQNFSKNINIDDIEWGVPTELELKQLQRELDPEYDSDGFTEFLDVHDSQSDTSEESFKTTRSRSNVSSVSGKGVSKRVEDIYCGAYACGLIFGVLPHGIFGSSGSKVPQFVTFQKDIEALFGIPWVRFYSSRGGNTDREYKRIQEVRQQMEDTEKALQPDLTIQQFYDFVRMSR
jgi:hypothetical protein